jgi:hypothetical protein
MSLRKSLFASASLLTLGVNICVAATLPAQPTDPEAAVVTVSAGSKDCSVRILSSGAQVHDSSMPCANVVAYLQNEANVPRGSVVGLTWVDPDKKSPWGGMLVLLTKAGFKVSFVPTLVAEKEPQGAR